MDAERRQRISRLYHEALERPVDQRDAFLDTCCQGDDVLREEVASLLAHEESAESFLVNPAAEVVDASITQNSEQLHVGLEPGASLGTYRIERPLGRGGMGVVFLAHDTTLHRKVALKVLGSPGRDGTARGRLLREARNAAALNHPNICTVYEVGEADSHAFIAMEYIEGRPLSDRLTESALPLADAVRYGIEAADALAYAHDHGVIHRDLKAANAIVATTDRLKLVDFGLARREDALLTDTRTMPSLVATGVAVGTPYSMAPEQVRGGATDTRTDIWALGVLLYEMVSGAKPFAAPTTPELFSSILRDAPAPLPDGAPVALRTLIERCLEKEPAARYQSAHDLAFQLRLVQHPSSPAAVVPSAERRRRAAAASLVGAILLVATAGLTWWLTRPAPQTPAPTFRRLTSDSGLTTDPALSPDGRLVAYASDRAGAGNLDIWLQQLATGEAVRLTTDAADESEPTFSPDGSRIAFRSERDGGGIWVVPSIGGEPRLVATQGRRPRFSPDGTRIAYWVSRSAWYVGQAFTILAGGGSPSPVQPDFATALYPTWSTDGSKLLFLGARDPQDLPVGALDWWIVPASDGQAVQTGAVDILRGQQITTGRGGRWLIAPDEWIEDEVFFSGGADEHTNLWRLVVSPDTGKAEGSAQRLTSGTSTETKPSVLAVGRMAFASVSNALNIWTLPVAANSGVTSGGPQQVTSSAFDARTSVSADGKKLVFISTRLGNPDVWMKDLESGKEAALTATPAHEEEAEITPDGTRVFYTVFEDGRGVLYQIGTASGVPEKICDDCGRPWDWSPDGSKILYLIVEGRRGPNSALGLFDIATRQQTDYLVNPTYGLARVRFSPDARWISFTAVNKLGTHVAVAPFRRDAAPRENEWISITAHRSVIQDKARWSPDGNLLYYTSDLDGFRCVWAQRLDPETKRPVGQPLEVYHSHSARRALMNVSIPLFFELSLTADRLFFNLGETTGNIWMAEWSAPQ